MVDIKFGLIGGGYVAKAHAFAYHAVPAIFGNDMKPLAIAVADISDEAAARAARHLGFGRSTGDWRELVAAPDIDVITVATPNILHREMALAVIAAGKHLYLEKPLGTTLDDAVALKAAVAERPDRVRMLGYSYLCNPMIQQAKAIIASGEIGEVVYFRGRHNEDYLADPSAAHTWRCSRSAAGPGALGDLGSHIISIALYLGGEISSLIADLETIISTRRTLEGGMAIVDNDDQAHCLLRFASGAMGALETSRVAHGQKLGLAFEVIGSKGSLRFDQERMNELRLYESGAPDGRRGFKTLLVSTDCPDFAAFCPAAGHGLGYNDLKVIEVHRLLRAIVHGDPVPVDLGQAVAIEQVIEACVLSARERTWIRPEGLG